jgi:hypothetical protein
MSIECLPDELVMAIVGAIDDPTAVLAWSLVSRRYHGISVDPSLWRRMYEARFGLPMHVRFEAHGKNWRWLYRACAVDGTRAGVAVGRLRIALFLQGTPCVYWGDIADGLPHGYGLAISLPTPFAHPETLEPLGDANFALDEGHTVYEGQWARGQRHGHGALIDATIDYEGQHENDAPHGNGTCRFPNACYTGTMHHGARTGWGVVTYSNGQRHEGNFQDGKAHGYGIHTWPHGERHEGWYENDNMNGPGLQKFPNGTTYRGQFRDGVRHGHGTLTWNGRTYTGGFHLDLMHGFGVCIYPSGSTFRGQYEREQRQGWGVFTFAADRSRLWGRWSEDKRIEGEVVDHGTRRLPCTATSRCRACACAPKAKPSEPGIPVSFLDSL